MTDTIGQRNFSSCVVLAPGKRNSPKLGFWSGFEMDSVKYRKYHLPFMARRFLSSLRDTQAKTNNRTEFKTGRNKETRSSTNLQQIGTRVSFSKCMKDGWGKRKLCRSHKLWYVSRCVHSNGNVQVLAATNPFAFPLHIISRAMWWCWCHQWCRT